MILFIVELFVNVKCFGFYIKASSGQWSQDFFNKTDLFWQQHKHQYLTTVIFSFNSNLL